MRSTVKKENAGASSASDSSYCCYLIKGAIRFSAG